MSDALTGTGRWRVEQTRKDGHYVVTAYLYGRPTVQRQIADAAHAEEYLFQLAAVLAALDAHPAP